MRSCAVLITCLTLTACGGDALEQPQKTFGPAPEDRIAASLERLEGKVAELALIQKARHKTRVDPVPFAPTELQRRIAHYDYTGHVARIAQDIAEQSGYEFKLFGRQPNIPILVTVNWIDITLIDALKDLGVKAGHRATIAVDADEGVIEVRYDG